MDKKEFEEIRSEVLKELRKWCGEIPTGGPLNVVEKERREYRTHTEIRISYDGDPGERIPAYLLIPRGIGSERRPAIFAAHQCGWTCDIGKEQVVGKCVDWPDQAYGLELVREGFVVLAPDANKVGERFDPKLREQWQTPADLGNSQRACCCSPGGLAWNPRKSVYDVMRGIDVLCENHNVNADLIGMIGHSMGASLTLRAMPLDNRIKAGAISGGGGLGAEVWNKNNGKKFGLYLLETMQLIAPRPFFEAVGNEDHHNICTGDEKDLPVAERMKHKYEVIRAAREFYQLHNLSEEYLQLFEFNGGHQFPVEARKAAYAFLKKHLMDK